MANQRIGIQYPISRGSTGYFQPSYDSLTDAKNNIRNLMHTRKGTRPGFPEYGSSLWNVAIFESLEDSDVDMLESTIETDLQKWLPEIKIASVKVERSSSDIDTYIIRATINFRLSSNSDIESFQTDIQL